MSSQSLTLKSTERRSRRRWGRAALVAAGLLLAGAIIALITERAYTPPILDDQGKPIPGSIASLEEVEINHAKQLLLIRGASKELPVLLFVHGGLGTPYSALAHTFQREWERRFIVVHWEQRGSGKLYDATDPSSITTQQLLDDTHAVALYLNQRFGKKIYLIAHSWGTYLGFRTVASYPELFEAYIGIGQTVGILKEDQHSHNWVLQEAARRNDQEALRAMESIGPPPYADVSHAYEVKYGLVAKYGGFLNHPDGMAFMFKSVIAAPEYTLLDSLRYIQGMSHYETALLRNGSDEIWHLSIEDIQRVDVPVYFFYGEYDQATPGAVLEAYTRTLSAPQKLVIQMDGAAHFPFIEQKDEFARQLFDRVLASNIYSQHE